jgi:hypothetical protein
MGEFTIQPRGRLQESIAYAGTQAWLHDRELFEGEPPAADYAARDRTADYRNGRLAPGGITRLAPADFRPNRAGLRARGAPRCAIRGCRFA